MEYPNSEVITYPKRLIKLHNDELMIMRKLPKGLEPSDFCKSENLIEFENTRDGDRFWLKVKKVFAANISKGTIIRITEDWKSFNIATVAEIKPYVFRGCNYIVAVIHLGYLDFCDDGSHLPF